MGSGSSRPKPRCDMTAQEIVDDCGERSNVKNARILVTGATAGIGLETARVLAIAGAKVYLMARSQTKLQEVLDDINKELRKKSSTGSVHGVLCDLNSLASVKQFAESFAREKTPINILVLNAGIFNTKFAQTVDSFEQNMGVNHIAHAYLTQLLMPTLIVNAPSRIVVVSSNIHPRAPIDYQTMERMSSTSKDAKKGWGMLVGYQQSKLANVLFARALASRYGDKKVTAYSLHPGVIKTSISADIPIIRFMLPFLKKKTVEQGAATTVYCALKPNLEKESGKYFDDSTVTNLAEKWSEDDVNTLWEWTEKVIQERTAGLS